jgi:hypothetical protein
VILGITLFIAGRLQVFGFAPSLALLVQLERLIQQVQAGNFKTVEIDNFPPFF